MNTAARGHAIRKKGNITLNHCRKTRDKSRWSDYSDPQSAADRWHCLLCWNCTLAVGEGCGSKHQWLGLRTFFAYFVVAKIQNQYGAREFHYQYVNCSTATVEQADLLKLKKDAPCWVLRALTKDTQDKTIEYLTSIKHPQLVVFKTPFTAP